MSRNTTIDLMRFIGILLIILAHVEPPNFIFQLRTFDVPMMVFVSGMAYYYSGKTRIQIIPYITSRFKRLVLPVWIFFSLFFSFIYFFPVPGFESFLTLKTVILTFMLSGFGYVWIIKVFLLIALLSPILTLLANKVNGYYISIISLFFLVISLCFSNSNYSSHGSVFFHLVNDIIVPGLSYGSVFILGYKSIALTKKEVMFSLGLFSIVLIAYIVYNYLQRGHLDAPQAYKYPPSLYFISFSLIMIWLVFGFFSFLKIEKINPVISFVSANTIWIYLWHIPVVEFFKKNNVEYNFLIKYILAVLIATLITLIQVSVVREITKDNKKSIITTIFTG